MKPVVIVGTGLAGYTTAREFRKHDSETPLVLVSADDGTSYSKPMLSNSFARGKTPEDLAQADASQMAEQLGATIHTERRVTSIEADGPAVTLDDGERLEAGRLVLGIGASQVDPGLEGDGAADVHAVNDLRSYARVREALAGARRVVLIGGGLIGCEFANDWRKGGYEVTVIEPCEYPMGTMLPPLAGQRLHDALLGQGIRFLAGRKATAVERGDGGLAVHDDAGEAHPADVVVRAIGLRPNTALAEAAGLETGRGIRTDRALETSRAGIHALGDCAEVDGIVLPFVMPINHCARALGPTLAGTRTEVDYPVMPVIAKTPCCPVQMVRPAGNVSGEWSEEQVEGGTRSLYHDTQGTLRGFCLTGAAVQEKGQWIGQVPKTFDNR